MSELTRAELAERLGLSVSALRKYEREFDAWLTSPPGVKGMSTPKVYNEHDVVILATIVAMRREGLPLDTVKLQLDERLATATSEALPPPPELEDERRVAMTLYMDSIRQLEATEGELTAIRDEREYLRRRVEELESELRLEVERRAKAEALRDVSPTLWQRLFGGSPPEGS